MTNPDLEKLKELAKRATPGPWVTNEAACYNTYPGVYLIIGDQPNTDDEKIVINDDEAKAEDLKYIAAVSPDVVLKLIGEVERHKQCLKSICDEYEECEPNCDSYGHEETCRSTYIVNVIKSLRASLKSEQEMNNLNEVQEQLAEAREVVATLLDVLDNDWPGLSEYEKVGKARAYLEKYPEKK